MWYTKALAFTIYLLARLNFRHTYGMTLWQTGHVQKQYVHRVFDFGGIEKNMFDIDIFTSIHSMFETKNKLFWCIVDIFPQQSNYCRFFNKVQLKMYTWLGMYSEQCYVLFWTEISSTPLKNSSYSSLF